jgi:hypothetical protein
VTEESCSHPSTSEFVDGEDKIVCCDVCDEVRVRVVGYYKKPPPPRDD